MTINDDRDALATGGHELLTDHPAFALFGEPVPAEHGEPVTFLHVRPKAAHLNGADAEELRQVLHDAAEIKGTIRAAVTRPDENEAAAGKAFWEALSFEADPHPYVDASGKGWPVYVLRAAITRRVR